MAFSRQGNYLTTGNKTTSTSIAGSPSSAIAVGELALVAFVSDNQGTTAGNTTLVSVSDTQSNSWTRLFEHTETGGTSGDGVTTALFYSVITTQIGTGDTITVSHNNIVAKAMSVDVWTSNGIDSVETAAVNRGSSTSPSATISGLSSIERLWIGVCGWENKSTGFTEDSGFSTAEQANFHVGDTGGPTSCVAGSFAYLVATQTGDTYAPTITSSDWSVGIVAFVETAGSTPVNKDTQLVWDMLNLVNKDNQVVFDIFNLVNKDNQVVFDIFNLVNKDTQLVWDMAQLVNKDTQLVWDMSGVVNKDMQVLWDLLNLVNKDTQLVWDMLSLVNKDTQLVWDMAQLVNKDTQLVWDMSGVVNKDTQIVWDLLNLVNKDTQLVWDLLNLVNKDTQLVWDMTQLVNKDTQLVWDMSGIVGKDTQLVFDILSLIYKENQLVFDILNLVNKDTQLVWDMAQFVNKDAQLVWDIEAGAGIVNKDMVLVYDINGEPVVIKMSDDEDFIQGYRR